MLLNSSEKKPEIHLNTTAKAHHVYPSGELVPSRHHLCGTVLYELWTHSIAEKRLCLIILVIETR